METQTSAIKTWTTLVGAFVWRWTCRFFLVCLGIIILGVLLFGWEYYLAMQPEAIQLGRQTTWIEGPKRKDGFPDYVAAMEAKLSRGIDPSKNCVPVLAQLIGPEFVTGDGAKSYYEKLGVKRPVDDEKLFYGWFDYFGRSAKTGLSKVKLDVSVRDTLMETPWDPSEHPAVAKWIKNNESIMDKIETCANKTQYYHPFVFMNAKKDVHTVLLQAAQEIREINCFLACRAQLAIHEKQFDKAAKCSELLLKLASLLDQSPFFVSGFIACYGRKSAFDIESTLATQVDWSNEKVEKRIELFRHYQSLPMYVERVNWGDRTIALDAIRIGMQDRFLLAPNPIEQIDQRAIKGEMFGWFSKVELYKSVNRHIDTIIEYTDPHDARNYDRERRFKADKFLHFLGNHSKYEWIFYFLSGRKIRSRYLAEFIVASRISKTELHVDVEVKRFMYDRLIQVAWHTRLFQSNKNRLPNSLSELKQEYPNLNVTDMFSKNPILFNKQADSVQIYSRGPDWRDNTNPKRADYQYMSNEGFQRIKRESDDILITFAK